MNADHEAASAVVASGSALRRVPSGAGYPAEMSMLTPTGSGGRRRTGRSHRRGTLLVLVAVVVVLAVGGGLWWWTTQTPQATVATPSPSPSCRTPAPKPPRDVPPPAQVQVNVLNGTDTPGLAIKTADQLVRRGFGVAGIGNSPKPMPSGVAAVLYAKPGYGAAVRVASYLPGAQLQLTQRLRGSAVDLRLGPDFKRVATSKQAAHNLKKVALPTPAPRCS
ncbi:MAG: LytR C-terminal domain-containing protein [Actinomycetes bacterium]